jgi:hypothetical protein
MKLYFKEIVYEIMDQLKDLVNTIIISQIPQNVENFLTG